MQIFFEGDDDALLASSKKLFEAAFPASDDVSQATDSSADVINLSDLIKENSLARYVSPFSLPCVARVVCRVSCRVCVCHCPCFCLVGLLTTRIHTSHPSSVFSIQYQ